MSEKSSQSLRGKRRREVDTPLIAPELDAKGVMEFLDWRQKQYKQPILDRLTGFYRFGPTKNGAMAYAQPDPIRMPEGIVAIGPEAAKALIQSRREAEVSRERQRIHIAASAELATSLFWTVAVMRKAFLTEALGKVSENQQPEWDVAGYAADAILDLGLCLESPYEHHPRFAYRKGKPLPQGMKTKIDEISPDLGTHIAEFGKYTDANRENLRSADGIVLMEAALDEQEWRIQTWQPRHQAVTEAFPSLPISDEILNHSFNLDELLTIEADLRNRQ